MMLGNADRGNAIFLGKGFANAETSAMLAVKNLDHLGLIAGIVDDLGVVDIVNERLGEDPREQISGGVVVKAMILNGLGFVSAPLYMFEQFFKGKATEHLLGAGVIPEHLNDDRLGRVLDGLYLSDITSVFVSVCLSAVKRYGLSCKQAHLDATSLSVTGAYLNSGEDVAIAGTGPIDICHGYSRDHRPDLKQFVMNLVCWGDGDIPAFLELADGNQSDKARFCEVIEQFQQQWDFDGLYVADGALYSADNLKQLTPLRWISRVPMTVSAASSLVEDIHESAFYASPLDGYHIAEVGSTYGDIRQRWVVVESRQRQGSDLKALEKRLAKVTQRVQTQLERLSRQPFACKADAQQAIERFERTLKYHCIPQVTITAKPHYGTPGRPAKTATPTAIHYHVQASLALDSDAVERQKRRAGRFILATNELSSPLTSTTTETLDERILSPDDILGEYKAQQGIERGFRFLKDPLFFASSVFLKSPERIMALAMIMALCLLVYNLGQRQLRHALSAANESIPNQLGKPTQTPTLRWVFQSFMAIHLVTLQGQQQVLNLEDNHRKILRFLGSAAQEYYLLC